ncbi:MAG: putative LPS assembly protein LptD [Mucilaginibacter sp.]
MKFISLFFLLATFLLVGITHASDKNRLNSFYQRVDTTKKDTVKNKKPLKGKKTSATSAKKTVAANDTTQKNQNDIDSQVHATAEDSTFVDVKNNVVYLWGNARVTYTDFELDANYIKVDKKNHMLYARGSIDPKTHQYVGRPISKQKNESAVESDSIVFNYETKKGKLFNPSTKQQDNYITHGQIKKLNENEVALRNIIFTTCDKPDPDFGIVITRGIAEKKQIISGPAYLEILGIPFPIGLPFAFFPKQDTRTSGVILPTFGEDAKLGFYLRGFGYYLGLSDYADLTTTGTYYTNGSFEVNSTLAYFDRYRYNGNLSLSYGSHNYGLEGDKPVKDFNITWSHSQNPNSSPGSTFSASVNAGTSTFYQNNPGTMGFNLTALTQNSLRSSIAYGRTWTGLGTPNLTVSLSHSQDLTAKTVTMELPTFNFSIATISPFDSKDRVAEQKWYQKITIGYNVTGTNKLTSIPESELFQGSALRKMQNGLQHQIPIGLNLNVLKYFQFNTSVNYSEQWYFQTIRKHYARADSLVTDTVPGFQRAGEYSLNAGFSTKLYGLFHVNIGNITYIRHVMTPNISFTYRPDYSSLGYGFNKQIVSNATIPYPVTYTRYSIYDGLVYGGPSGGRQAGINFSLDNSLEAKLRPKSTDTSQTAPKLWILQDLSLSTFYNFAADSFKLSPITFSGHTSFLHDKLNVSFGGSFFPYVIRVKDTIENNQVRSFAVPINRFTFQDGRLPTLTSFNISASISLNPQVFHPTPQTQQAVNTLQNMNPQQAAKLALINRDANAYVDFNMPYNISLNYSYTYTNNTISTANVNTLGITGDLKITENWKIQYTTNVDLRVRQVSSATSFAIYRKLHCWDLNISWLPFGYYKSYNVTLRANATILQDLKLSKRSDYTNNAYFTQ